VYGPQAVPQLPQFFGSTWVFVQAAPHRFGFGAAHTRPQLPPAQTWGEVHLVPQAPQLLLSVCSLVQMPLQFD
jgi:hypothetical protein